MDNAKYFSEYIKELRLEKGLTQKALSSKIGISQASIARLENQSHKPQIETLVAYSLFFNISTDKLLGLEDNF